MSISDLAQSFVKFYYDTFDSNPQQLAGVYQDDSMLTFEGGEFLGTQNIINKFASIGAKFHHTPNSLDTQPLPDNAVLVVVTGSLTIDDNQPLQISETFILKRNASGSYYVANDILRLVYM